MIRKWKVVRKMSTALLAAVLAFSLGTGSAGATSVLQPMLLTYSDLFGWWAPDTGANCLAQFDESDFQHDGAGPVAGTCLGDKNFDEVDELLGLWPSHVAAEDAWHTWVVNDEQNQGVNRVNPHHSFPVPVVFDEDTSNGIGTVSWEVTAVKGRVFVDLVCIQGPKVNPVSAIFEKALAKIRGM